MSFNNYRMKLYGILGLEPSATESEIKKSYYKLAKIYHPDKNNGNKAEEFQQINYAYNILINPKTREEYLKLNSNQEDNFIEFIIKITNNNLSMDDLSKLNIKIKDLVDMTINKWNLKDFIKNLDFVELFKIFNNVKISTKSLLTETEEDVDNTILYYHNLPNRFIDYNKNNIILDFDVDIDDIINNVMKKIKIIRNIGDNQIKENFVFEIKTPFIVFPNKGDNNNGHLIINLNIDDNIEWYKDNIMINYPVSIHQFIYGLDVNINIYDENFKYNKWIPNRDGNMIYIKDYNISIRFIIEYDHSDEKEQIILNL